MDGRKREVLTLGFSTFSLAAFVGFFAFFALGASDPLSLSDTSTSDTESSALRFAMGMGWFEQARHETSRVTFHHSNVFVSN
jgi:hypothetical protein